MDLCHMWPRGPLVTPKRDRRKRNVSHENNGFSCFSFFRTRSFSLCHSLKYSGVPPRGHAGVRVPYNEYNNEYNNEVSELAGMTMMGKKKLSQEAFDAAVEDLVDGLGLEIEEAIESAC